MGSGSQSQRSKPNPSRTRAHRERINEGEEDPIERDLIYLILGSLGMSVSILSSSAAAASSSSPSTLELCLFQVCSKHKKHHRLCRFLPVPATRKFS